MKTFTIKGKIKFDPKNHTKKHEKQSEWKKSAIVLLNCDTHKYYSWLIENRFGLHHYEEGKNQNLYKKFGLQLESPLRGTHFTVINDRVETKEEIAKYKEAKAKWDGKEIEFTYVPDYRTDDKHFWFRIYSDDAIKIRNDAGMGKSHWGFHLTIGLVSESRREFCEYIHRQMLRFPNNC